MLFFSFLITNHSNSVRRRDEEGNTSSSHPFCFDATRASRRIHSNGGEGMSLLVVLKWQGSFQQHLRQPFRQKSQVPATDDVMERTTNGLFSTLLSHYHAHPRLQHKTEGHLVAAHHRPLIPHHTIPPSLELEVDAAVSSKVRPLFYFIPFL